MYIVHRTCTMYDGHARTYFYRLPVCTDTRVRDVLCTMYDVRVPQYSSGMGLLFLLCSLALVINEYSSSSHHLCTSYVCKVLLSTLYKVQGTRTFYYVMYSSRKKRRARVFAQGTVELRAYIQVYMYYVPVHTCTRAIP